MSRADGLILGGDVGHFLEIMLQLCVHLVDKNHAEILLDEVIVSPIGKLRR